MNNKNIYRKKIQSKSLKNLEKKFFCCRSFVTFASTAILFFLPTHFISQKIRAESDFSLALRRAKYILTATLPSDTDFANAAGNLEAYKQAIRAYINDTNFYDSVLRLHERILGVGLPAEYLDELLRPDADGRQLKIARLQCQRGSQAKERFTCRWVGGETGRNKTGQCPKSMQEPVTPFWKPDIVVWVCPSVARACGSNLGKCFIEYANEDEARNTELGTSDAFDSRFTIVRSLSRQAAGLAAAVVTENYPYTKILEPGLSAVDGAIAHLLSQSHHFDVSKLKLPNEIQEQLKDVNFNETKFKLIYTGNKYEHAGILTTFGWLRRYEKNRTRANQLYERLMCRKFTAELPKVFPQDPGNLRITKPCSDCHAALDPLADFFLTWGEGGELYDKKKATKSTYFAGKEGKYVSDLAQIMAMDEAFAACAVQHAWDWLMGRQFFKSEEKLRDTLTDYFVSTDYSFKELVFAIATHPAFLNSSRTDSLVTDPLAPPPLGKVPETKETACPENLTFAQNIEPYLGLCTNCHRSGSSRKSLENEGDWRALGKVALGLMASGSMPPGRTGAPTTGDIFELKEAVRCWNKQEGL